MYKGKLLTIGIIAAMLVITAGVSAIIGVYLSDQYTMHNDAIDDSSNVILSRGLSEKVYSGAIPYQDGEVKIGQAMLFTIEMASEKDHNGAYLELNITGDKFLTNTDVTMMYWNQDIDTWQSIYFDVEPTGLHTMLDMGIDGGFLLFEGDTTIMDFVLIYNTVGSYDLTWGVYQ